MKINELNKYYKNPRKITDKQKELLKRDLKELGDLSGIVHDLNSNEIIGGNQRSIIFQNAEIQITEEFNKPTKTGTVAFGYIIFNKEKYNYRQVKWTKKQCEKANIVANKAGGDWDFDLLNEFDFDDLVDWGFEENELKIKTEGKISKINLDPFKKTHILLSFPPEKFIEIADLIEQIKAKNFIDYEQSSN